MKRRNIPKYGFLGLTGAVLLVLTLVHVSILPKSQACGSSPNCPNNGSWTVSDYGCNGSCSCSGNPISYTCYYESGLCNNTDSPQGAYYSHCFQYTCTCPSGGGGGGSEGGGDWCFSDFDCSSGFCGAGGYCEGGNPDPFFIER